MCLCVCIYVVGAMHVCLFGIFMCTIVIPSVACAQITSKSAIINNLYKYSYVLSVLENVKLVSC